jgi:hypothetical protein
MTYQPINSIATQAARMVWACSLVTVATPRAQVRHHGADPTHREREMCGNASTNVNASPSVTKKSAARHPFTIRNGSFADSRNRVTDRLDHLTGQPRRGEAGGKARREGGCPVEAQHPPGCCA